jgi:hypothetical protein
MPLCELEASQVRWDTSAKKHIGAHEKRVSRDCYISFLFPSRCINSLVFGSHPFIDAM